MRRRIIRLLSKYQKKSIPKRIPKQRSNRQSQKHSIKDGNRDKIKGGGDTKDSKEDGRVGEEGGDTGFSNVDNSFGDVAVWGGEEGEGW